MAVIPVQAGIQMIEYSPAKRDIFDFVCFAAIFSCWIPACAGMTELIDQRD